MVNVCFYFQVHQPERLRNYTVFDIGNKHNYFDEQKNRELMEKVAMKCYLPMNNLILRLIKKYKGKFKVSYSISGVALNQFEKYSPKVLESFKELAKTGCVDFLTETYHHSLSFIYSKEEFRNQIEMHKNKIKELFGIEPTVFRNTELIFNNELAEEVHKMGFNTVLAEGADKILGWRSPNFVYTSLNKNVKLLLKNYKLSDDIAFRFSNKSWKEHPLTVPKFSQWLNSTNGNGEIINLFMDYETFGEHQWADTGIFDFMEHLPEEILKHPDNNFVTVGEAAQIPAKSDIDFPYFVSWADTERDLTAWVGNDIQNSAIKELYAIESHVKSSGDEKLIEDWRNLTTSDHFYYMCTKWFNDGDVHKYFSPYDSPYDAFISFMNVLNDIAIRLSDKNKKTGNEELLNRIKSANLPVNSPVMLINN